MRIIIKLLLFYLVCCLILIFGNIPPTPSIPELSSEIAAYKELLYDYSTTVPCNVQGLIDIRKSMAFVQQKFPADFWSTTLEFLITQIITLIYM